MRTAFFLAALAFVAATATLAEARPARCVITDAGGTVYRGPCEFRSERGGSFWVEGGPNQEYLTRDIAQVSVALTSRDRGEARSLNRLRNGPLTMSNTRWGDVRRSRRDPACWIGTDFRICVY